MLKLNEWQSPSGKWYVSDINGKNKWWIIPRLLDISFDKYILLLYNKYNVRNFKFFTYNDERNSLLLFSFDNKEDAHNFLLYVSRRIK